MLHPMVILHIHINLSILGQTEPTERCFWFSDVKKMRGGHGSWATLPAASLGSCEKICWNHPHFGGKIPHFWWTFLYVFDLAIIIPSSVGFDDFAIDKETNMFFLASWRDHGSFKTADPIFYEELATSTRIGRGIFTAFTPWVWGLVVARFFFGEGNWKPSTTSRSTGLNQTFLKACLERCFLQFFSFVSKVWLRSFSNRKMKYLVKKV